MKKLFTILAICFAVCAVNAQILNEGFENGIPSTWTTLDEDGDGVSWEVISYTETQLPAHSGDKCISSASYINNYGALTPNNYLITPAINIPANGATLAWYVIPQDPAYAADHYQVLVSTGGTNASDFTTVIFDEDVASSTDWAYKSIWLGDYAGQSIRLAFAHNNCTDFYMMKIDDITISEGVGVNTASDVAISIYPNPVSNVLTVSAEGYYTLEIANILGQTIYSQDMTNNAQINVENFNNGVYFVRLIGENGTKVQKIVKK